MGRVLINNVSFEFENVGFEIREAFSDINIVQDNVDSNNYTIFLSDAVVRILGLHEIQIQQNSHLSINDKIFMLTCKLYFGDTEESLSIENITASDDGALYGHSRLYSGFMAKIEAHDIPINEPPYSKRYIELIIPVSTIPETERSKYCRASAVYMHVLT